MRITSTGDRSNKQYEPVGLAREIGVPRLVYLDQKMRRVASERGDEEPTVLVMRWRNWARPGTTSELHGLEAKELHANCTRLSDVHPWVRF